MWCLGVHKILFIFFKSETIRLIMCIDLTAYDICIFFFVEFCQTNNILMQTIVRFEKWVSNADSHWNLMPLGLYGDSRSFALHCYLLIADKDFLEICKVGTIAD